MRAPIKSVQAAVRRRSSVVVGVCVVVASVAVGASPAAAGDPHVVAPGETLSEIARDHGVSTSDLMSANGIADADRIRVGQTLSISPVAQERYEVQPGDALSVVAQRLGVSLSSLIDANGIDDPNRIRAGTQLVVPSGGAVSPDAAVPAVDRQSAESARPGLPTTIVDDPNRRALIPIFERWADANGIDTALLMAIAWQESGWNNEAVSSSGAIGIGQLMPATSGWVARDLIGRPELDPLVSEDNIRMSARFVRWLLVYMDSEDAAIAAYFQGPGAVLRSEELPESTLNYVANVQSLRERFARR